MKIFRNGNRREGATVQIFNVFLRGWGGKPEKLTEKEENGKFLCYTCIRYIKIKKHV